MATKKYNKVVYGGQTLIDLTTDTITPDKLLTGYTAHDKSGDSITGTCTFDSNTQDATATMAEILKDKTAYVRGSKLTGTMPNRGGVTGFISTKDGEYTIPQGYHDGSGSVELDATEKAKLIASNIRQGVTLLGVEGTMSGTEGAKAESKTVTPTKNGFTVTPGEGFNYLSQVLVNPIPYQESDNSAGGITVTIG